MKLVAALLVGILLGAGAMALVPRWRPSPEVKAKEEEARVARVTADSAKAVARAAVDSLEAWRPVVERALAKPRRVEVGPTPGTVTILPTSSTDEPRVVTVPPEVVDQLAQDHEKIGSLLEERTRSMTAIARLEAAAEKDSLADLATDAFHAAAVVDLTVQLEDARREARLWKWVGRGVLVVGGVVVVSKGVSALLN